MQCKIRLDGLNRHINPVCLLANSPTQFFFLMKITLYILNNLPIQQNETYETNSGYATLGIKYYHKFSSESGNKDRTIDKCP